MARAGWVRPSGVLAACTRLAGRESRVACRLLFGGAGNLLLRLLGGQTVGLGLGAGLCGLDLSLTLDLGGQTNGFPFGRPQVPGLDDRAPRGLPSEDDRIIGRRACPEPGQCGLPRSGRLRETIDEVIGFQRLHELSVGAPDVSPGGETWMKPLRGRNGFEARHEWTRETQAA